MTSSILPPLITITIVFSLSRVWGISPKIFVPTSNATCQPEYAWMSNAEQQNPCLAVAYVIAACVGDTWTQPALPPGYSYDSPNGTTATPCYCSWSCYNLMMGCTICQNPAYASDLRTWSSFSQNCPSNYKDDVFPRGYVLADNASSIPYWATVNPTSWPSELFDVEQAKSYANQNYPDSWPSVNSASSSRNSGSSTNFGAIIGSTVGGAVGVLLVLVGGYFLYKRRKYLPIAPVTSAHTRWPSDPSTVLPTTQSGIGPGVRVLSHAPRSSFPSTLPLPPTETQSFLTTGNTVVQHTRAIPMV